MSWERKLVDPLVDHGRIVLAILALITVVLGAFIPRLGFDSSIEGWFVDNDPDMVEYRAFLDRFGADEIVLVALFAPERDPRGVFTAERLAMIDALGERIDADTPWVHRARSLANTSVYSLRTEGDTKTIVIEPVVPTSIPESPEALAAIRSRALASDLLAGAFVSEDGAVAAIVVELTANIATVDRKSETVAAIEAHIAALRTTYPNAEFEYEIAGNAVLDIAFVEYSKRDFTVLGPAAVLVLLVMIWLAFRRWVATLVPLAVVCVATVWLFGLMAIIGRDVDIMASGLAVLVMAVGIADTVHVLSAFDQRLAAGIERDEAVRDAVAELVVPCLFTSLTTVGGLLSLSISDLDPVRWFGILAAVGVVFAFLLSITLVPAVLQLVAAPPEDHLRRVESGRLGTALVWLGRPTRAWRLGVLGVSAVVIAAATWGVTQLEVGSNPINYFRDGDPVRTATIRVDAALGGTSSVEFLVESPNEGLRRLAVLERLDAFETYLLDLPRITHVSSPLDAQRELNRLWTDGRPESAVLPDSNAKVAALYRMLRGEDVLESVLEPDYEAARITARVQLSRAGELSKRIPEIEDHLAEQYDDDELEVTATGVVKLVANMERYLLRSQVESLLIAFVVVTFMILLLLRSPLLGLYSMIPNLLPILLGIGFMGASGIALDPGTVMIGSITLGLVVDDTVHFLVRVNRYRTTAALPDAIDLAMRQTGRPIVVTTLVLASCFAILAAGSSIAPNFYFGIISALVILAAVVADLVVLPAAMLTFSRGASDATPPPTSS